MKEKLELYQEAALSSKALLLAAVLHPKHRLRPFAADYKDKIEDVKLLLQEAVQTISEKTTTRSKKAPNRDEPALKKKWQRDIEVDSADVVPVEQTEIDAYLANRHPFRTAVKDSNIPGHTVLSWWKENEVHYPVLAKLARRYLSPPGSTSEVERVFSKAGRYVAGRRPLGPTSLEHLVVTSQLLSKGFAAFPALEGAGRFQTPTVPPGKPSTVQSEKAAA
ncbi:hypothetical protein A4X09_0g7185 [Tilletia walkeri]|uniref:HAT C-terminal dimerisation domain-containing protein n=1 Tax=Tilletia walkeri TaxID=117179 RepID=A0A8X7N2C1_9BASI|nr:hypothetical protein A4X09_0g7185 [Tilletia walkeri]